ncbi:MAG: hypothetical protein QM756_36725 [Polyangiaceae bacterium]
MSLENAILRAGSLAGVGAGVFFVAYRVACVPTQSPNWHGLRGARRLQTLRKSPLFAQAEPLIRWLSLRLAPFVPQSARIGIERQLMLGGDFLGLAPDEFVALSLLAAAGGSLAGAAYAALLGKSVLYPILFTLLGAALPYLELSGREHERRRQVSNALPHAVDLIALGLSAGLDFPGALRQLVENRAAPMTR